MKEIRVEDIHQNTVKLIKYFRSFLNKKVAGKSYKIYFDNNDHWGSELTIFLMSQSNQDLDFCDTENLPITYNIGEARNDYLSEVDGFYGIINVTVDGGDLYIMSFKIASEFGFINMTIVGAKSLDHINELTIKIADFVKKEVREVAKKYVIQLPNEKKISKKNFPTFDDVILDEDLKNSIKNDIFSFLKSKEFYAERHIPFKRGILLCGPPGNGKTLMCKAIAKECNVPFYNIFFDDPRKAHIGTIIEAYETARKYGPAIVCIEDLDALSSADRDRSGFSEFLNILDGINELNGVITIATTNYPEKIDSALVDRPGRFDKVYNIPLPVEKYIKQYYAGVFTRLDDTAINEITKKSKDFSFAQLKEVYVVSNLFCYESKEYPSVEIINREISNIRKNIKEVKNAFSNKDSIGFGNNPRHGSEFNYEDFID